VSVAVGDLNGDGYPDILVADSNSLISNSYGAAVVFMNQTGIVAPTGTTTTLSSSPNPALTGQSIMLTATVTPVSGSGVPTGSVTFLDGSTNLGTVALTGSTATFTSSALSVGSHSLNASYSGNSGFNGSASSTLTQVVNATAFVITSTGSTTASVSAGATATYQLMLTPGTSSSQSVTLTCSGAPKDSMCSASPSPVTLSGNTPTAVTVTVQTTGSVATLAVPQFSSGSVSGLKSGSQFGEKFKTAARGEWLGAISLLFAGLLWMGGRHKPRRVALGLLLGSLLLLAACSGSGNNGRGGGTPGTPAGTYTLNVTATSIAGTQTLQLKLTVN